MSGACSRSAHLLAVGRTGGAGPHLFPRRWVASATGITAMPGRDASIGIAAFVGVGKDQEARAFLAWLLPPVGLLAPACPRC